MPAIRAEFSQAYGVLFCRPDKVLAPPSGNARRGKKFDGVEYFFSAIFIYAREGNPYANVFFFC
ncbi:hypothetical protein EVY06_16670 [Citrobacter koseri]|uniref:Uncharacterized protein n=1 Tax=Citrobacter koseri TaxID=545 RepID=A0AAQ0V748_CITKO|nr:hypothetical protein EGS84_10490 [Citrobacter koseri]RZA63165.1 hypothetical protein EVX99_11115 [Citrobacter koseri]RZA98779.1 hypothetical protein EVY06_16670 [Citrobacter koseri]TFU42385.1 hypothetical protein E4T98_10010 [Citrobacter koseri]